MGLYIRAYEDYSYEVISVEGVIKKKRLHIYVNPSDFPKLAGQKGSQKTEVNPASLTHIVCIETSVPNPSLIDRTVRIAQLTNKPIITNEGTAAKFKDKGISVSQLRIIGFEEEVIENLKIDPLYVEEMKENFLSGDTEAVKDERPMFIQVSENVVKKLNPLNWKPFQKITEKVIPDFAKSPDIDPSKPLALNLKLGKNYNLLVPCDHRAIDHIDDVLQNIEPHTLIAINQEINFTKTIPKGFYQVIILNGLQPENVQDLEIYHLPKTHNPGVHHNTLFGPLEEWIELE